jgi:hypothetical protein
LLIFFLDLDIRETLVDLHYYNEIVLRQQGALREAYLARDVIFNRLSTKIVEALKAEGSSVFEGTVFADNAMIVEVLRRINMQEPSPDRQLPLADEEPQPETPAEDVAVDVDLPDAASSPSLHEEVEPAV